MIYNSLIKNEDSYNKIFSFNSLKRLPNAFIFHGSDGSGKEAHAIEFSAFLNCIAPSNNDSCGSCSSCLKIKKLQHEYLRIILPLPKSKSLSKNDDPLKALNSKQLESLEKKFIEKGSNPYSNIEFKTANTIIINSIRGIKKELTLTIEENSTRIFIIMQAEKLCYPNNESANALLKILEEPPPNNLFILITSDISKMIDTIISRCVTIYFPAINKKKIQNFLSKMGISENDSEIISNISDGNIKKSLDLVKEVREIDFLIMGLIQNLLDQNLTFLKDSIVYFDKKHIAIDNLKYFNLFFRDLLIYKKTNNPKNLNFIHYEKEINKILRKHLSVDWEKCIVATNNTQKYFMKNGNPSLLITALLLEYKKIINKNYYNINILEDWLNYPV